MKVDWKKKLTSRKFWMAIAGVVVGVVTLIISFQNGEASLGQTITGCIMAGASIVAYIIGEGLTDAAAATATNIVEIEKEEKEE